MMVVLNSRLVADKIQTVLKENVFNLHSMISASLSRLKIEFDDCQYLKNTHTTKSYTIQVCLYSVLEALLPTNAIFDLTKSKFLASFAKMRPTAGLSTTDQLSHFLNWVKQTDPTGTKARLRA